MSSVMRTGGGAGKPLRVTFDHRIFLYQRHGGVSRYFVRLAQHLPEFGVETRVIAPFHVNAHLRDLPRTHVWGIGVPASRSQERIGRNLGNRLHAPLAKLFGAKIVHETYYAPERAAPTGTHLITTIHDMIFELNPTMSKAEIYISNKRASIERADKIICVSENTRRDLLTFYPHVESRTQVIRHGFDALSGESSAAVPLHGKPYLLYVGMRWRGYKNFNGLLTAYARMNDVQERSDLVCVGGGAFSAEEQVLLNELGLAGRVHQREAGDSDLHSWYRHAQLFVYPSLYEGFGIPPLEAMAAGCPAVCMHTSSIPEVCGDAVEYAEPDRPESLQAAIRNVLFSDERAEALRIAGKERLKLFSWRECARQTSQVYNSLV